MKILTSLLGLVLFIAGIYLSYWVFLDFEAFETLYLGLYLGGSFVLMTLGFFLFLLPLTFKSKKSVVDDVDTQTITQDLATKDEENEVELVEDVIEIDEEDAIKVSEVEAIEVSPMDDSPTIVLNSIQDSVDLEETVTEQEIEQNTSHQEDIDITQIMFQPILEDSQESKLFKLDEQYDIVEFRVIGIDTWSSQRILHKLDPQSKLELSQKSKAGINMTQVTYRNKLIGFISRLDMNKINDRMGQLVEVNPATIINDKHKIDHFSVNLKFKKEEVKHEQRDFE